MLYVERNKDGKIIALHKTPDPKAGEKKSIMDEEILDFLNENVDTDPWLQFLSLSDTGIIRILEDLIDLLIRKNVILFTELPEDALYSELMNANTMLIENYFENKKKLMAGQIKQLYLNRDISFRGFRQS